MVHSVNEDRLTAMRWISELKTSRHAQKTSRPMSAKDRDLKPHVDQNAVPRQPTPGLSGPATCS
ncbi:hypothetical protein DPMN_175684 [Dreissena polymorpha]|uniref:Uncharacterized protein n=1 Tax=Dreissena polymorpha TaxID=45954 RepID=A0A9D4IHG9_DREPO|nr:hypothetical protein DPMN_175684 [Dreissena polymorpha]